MKRPSVKWLAVAAAGCIFASSMGTYTYTALADEFVYTDANVSITSIVDHYIEEMEETYLQQTPLRRMQQHRLQLLQRQQQPTQ